MTDLLLIFLFTIGFVGAISLYFLVARSQQIVDAPGARSSHALPTIRGAGVVFLIPVGGWFITGGHGYPISTIAILLLGVISFVDDVRGLSASIRFFVQSLCFAMILYETGPTTAGVLILAFILGVGAINAFNFMDGINGITGLYALVNLGTFYFIDRLQVDYLSSYFLLPLVSAVLAFLFFNLRVRALCFAGDVGSVTLAAVQILILLILMNVTEYYGWILFFAVFGADSVVTILYRLKRRENIFKPHRSHLYQYMANEMAVPHPWVSMVYALTQLIINAMVIRYRPSGYSILLWIIMAGLLTILLRQLVIRRIKRNQLSDIRP